MNSDAVKNIVVCVFLMAMLAGCGESDHHLTIKNDSQKSVLKYTLPDGSHVELDLTSDITPEMLVALNTALANSQIQSLTYNKQQHAEATRRQVYDLTRFGAAILLVIVAMVACGLGFSRAVYFLNKGGRDE